MATKKTYLKTIKVLRDHGAGRLGLVIKLYIGGMAMLAKFMHIATDSCRKVCR